MAIIYSYPEKITPAGGDFLVITDSEQPAPNKNRTKSLTIDNLANYVVTSTSGITGSGTLNTIAMFTPDGQSLGDSFITQTTLPDAVNVSGRFNVSPGGVNALNVSQTGGTTGVVTIPGSLEVDGTYYDASGDEGTDGDVLVAKGTPGNMVTRWVSKANADIVSGSGTLNTIAMFTPDGQSVGDSGITQLSPEIIKIGTGIAGGASVLETNLLTCNIISGANLLTIQGNSIIGNEATDVLTVNSETEFNANVVFDLSGYVELRGAVRDNTGSPGTAGQVLSSTGTGVAWDDATDVVSGAVAKLIPYFQIATPGGSDTYTELNNIVDFDWSGGSGTYEYILPSATAIPYRKIRFVNNSTISASTKVHITAPIGETIDGGAFYEINKAYNGCAVWSDGVQWIVIQAKA